LPRTRLDGGRERAFVHIHSKHLAAAQMRNPYSVYAEATQADDRDGIAQAHIAGGAYSMEGSDDRIGRYGRDLERDPFGYMHQS